MVLATTWQYLHVDLLTGARHRVSAVKKLIANKRERWLVNQKLYQEWVDTVKIAHDWLFSETIPSVYTSDDVVTEEVGSLEELHQLIEQHKVLRSALRLRCEGIELYNT